MHGRSVPGPGVRVLYVAGDDCVMFTHHALTLFAMLLSTLNGRLSVETESYSNDVWIYDPGEALAC